MPRHRFGWIASGVLAVSFFARQVQATPPQAVPPEQEPPESNAPTSATANGGPFSEMARSSYMLGDMWGLRTELSKHGITLNISETSEVLGNVTGGAKRGAEYDGLTQM